jgi:crotonobetainyl-CoA:carnitine CoA-transferase CaiB-like acyl-CoA transferase
MGNAHFNIAPYEVFRAKDRWFVLGAANTRQWEMLCEVVGRLDLKDDPRFASNQDRVTNREELARALNEAFAAQDACTWLERLQDVGIPSGVINSIKDVFEHPQAEARGLRIEVEHPTAGVLEFPGFPYKLSESPAEAHLPPPLLGEHTDDAQDLLDTAEQVTILHQEGTI